VLDNKDATERATQLMAWQKAEADPLDTIYKYLRGKQAAPAVPRGVPAEIRRLAKMSRVNISKLVVDVPSQSMYVDGYRTPDGSADNPTWEVWQANRMDARQTGVHRAALAYGASYVRVTPGEPVPVIRGVSPRHMTAVYGEDESWPIRALERIPGRERLWRMYDNEAVYFFTQTDQSAPLVFDRSESHDLGVCPVVRFRNVEDLDDEHVSEIEPVMTLQDQMDLTTFGLLVCQHFQAFRQRAIIGWTTDDENEKLRAAASTFQTFEDPDVKLAEWAQANLDGYLNSRASTLELFAIITQIPPQHLLGKMVNLSAEALVAAETGHRRKGTAWTTSFGESWEQTNQLVAIAQNRVPDVGASVRWRDMEARAFAATVDGLAKLAQSLNVPVQMLWERIPGWTQQDTDRAERLLRENDVLFRLTDELERQAAL
jgi:hypothetical protein